jgi:pimeloyl-ACP methyl ester carboxylesterase
MYINIYIYIYMYTTYTYIFIYLNIYIYIYRLTAYHFMEPGSVSEDMAEEIPVIVCLHGLTNCSYMWADIVDLLADSEQGPKARVLIFDFYGRGRSPWTGVPITLDVLVTQTKELLDCKIRLYFTFMYVD